jgi:hypothetical protein
MLIVVPGYTRESYRLRASICRTCSGWLHAFVGVFRNAYFTAFPPEYCATGAWLIAQQVDISQPSPITPAGAIAMTDGARLYEIDGEPCSDSFIA